MARGFEEDLRQALGRIEVQVLNQGIGDALHVAAEEAEVGEEHEGAFEGFEGGDEADGGEVGEMGRGG